MSYLPMIILIFLRRGFLSHSLLVHLLLSPRVLVALSLTLVAKEVGVEGVSSVLGGCGTPNDEKGEYSRD
jgi:hypothetical protein